MKHLHSVLQVYSELLSCHSNVIFMFFILHIFSRLLNSENRLLVVCKKNIKLSLQCALQILCT